MVTATDFSCSVASGVTMRAGRAADDGLPAWLSGVPLNEWIEISGTSGADGNKIDAWCGFAVVQETGELLITLAGGHGDDYRTQVSSIDLFDDVPAWNSPRRRDSIPPELANSGQPYCLDGVTPSSRHTRYSTLYCPQNNRIMLMGSPSIYGPGVSAVESNGFNLATDQWDAPGTWPSMANNSNQGTCIDDVGNIWCRGQKWIRSSNTLTTIPGTATYRIVDFDTNRRQIFALTRGDGQTADTGQPLIIRTISEDLSLSRDITINSSAAFTSFSALGLEYSAMLYDQPRDRFLYYYGIGAGQGVVFVITPNAGTAWDMSILAQGPGSLLPTAPTSAGINARVKYVDQLDGIVMLPRQSSNIYFMRLG